MKTNVIIYILSMLCGIGCISNKSLSGTYKKKTGSTYKYELTLNSDSTFVLKYGESECSGKWQRTDDTTVLLKCGEEPIYNALSSNYMTIRDWKVIVIENNKLKIDCNDNIYKDDYGYLHKIYGLENVVLKRGKK
jgi:hypothetical protein